MFVKQFPRVWFLAVCFLACRSSAAGEWAIPFAGNAYQLRDTSTTRQNVFRKRTTTLSDSAEILSLYFHVDRATKLRASLTLRPLADNAQLAVTVLGQKPYVVDVRDGQSQVELKAIEASQSSYLRVDFQLTGESRIGVTLNELLVAAETPNTKVEYVATNDGNMFYWGRRGPSVHLRYETPPDTALRYAYSEITVPKGEDPVGTFYMANGFGEGYFGFQVNSPTQRRILFSVWSPFKTNNPKNIPADQRIELLAKGNDVHVGKFGNEGSGGQSYLVYPWRATRTYRFLTKVKPDGKGNTEYTSWFGDKANHEWRLIASFRRPKTDTNLRGFHSFLESFNPSTGYIGRQATYGNVWVCDVEGRWYECVKARFSTDATGKGRHRLDFSGGVRNSSFYLQNCGFFEANVTPGEIFERNSTASAKPDIRFGELPDM